MLERTNSVAMERTIQVKTYEITSPSGVPSTLKLGSSEWPLPDVLFPKPLWQHLRMGSLYGCWCLVSQRRDDFAREAELVKP